jgi:hypothetical protein
MFTTKEAALTALGRGDGFGKDELAEHLLVAVGAGTPTGTATVPTFVGQIYVDTTNHKIYVAEDIDDVDGFLILN